MFSGLDETQGKTEAVFAQLRERAQRFPPELNEEWFDQGLFKTRSTEINDYLAEAEKNAYSLLRLDPSSPLYGFMSSAVQEQLTALVQALYRP